MAPVLQSLSLGATHKVPSWGRGALLWGALGGGMWELEAFGANLHLELGHGGDGNVMWVQGWARDVGAGMGTQHRCRDRDLVLMQGCSPSPPGRHVGTALGGGQCLVLPDSTTSNGTGQCPSTMGAAHRSPTCS